MGVRVRVWEYMCVSLCVSAVHLFALLAMGNENINLRLPLAKDNTADHKNATKAG